MITLTFRKESTKRQTIDSLQDTLFSNLDKKSGGIDSTKGELD